MGQYHYKNGTFYIGDLAETKKKRLKESCISILKKPLRNLMMPNSDPQVHFFLSALLYRDQFFSLHPIDVNKGSDS